MSSLLERRVPVVGGGKPNLVISDELIKKDNLCVISNMVMHLVEQRY